MSLNALRLGDGASLSPPDHAAPLVAVVAAAVMVDELNKVDAMADEMDVETVDETDVMVGVVAMVEAAQALHLLLPPIVRGHRFKVVIHGPAPKPHWRVALPATLSASTMSAGTAAVRVMQRPQLMRRKKPVESVLMDVRRLGRLAAAALGSFTLSLNAT